MELKSKQRSYLRSLANTLTPIFQVGKDGLTETMCDEIHAAIEKRELIKVRVLPGGDMNAKETAALMAEAMPDINVVQVLGNVITLFGRAKEEKNRKIELPTK